MLTSLRPMFGCSKNHHFVEVESIDIPTRKTLDNYKKQFESCVKKETSVIDNEKHFSFYIIGYHLAISTILEKFSKNQRRILTQGFNTQVSQIDTFKKISQNRTNQIELTLHFKNMLNDNSDATISLLKSFSVGYQDAENTVENLCSQIIQEGHMKQLSEMSTYTSFWEVVSMELMSHDKDFIKKLYE